MQVATQSMSMAGSRLVAQQPRQPRAAAARRVDTQAIFGKKKAAVVVEEPPAKPARRGLFGGGSAKAQPAAATPKAAPKATKQKKATAVAEPLDKAAEYKRRQGAFGRVTSMLDFAEVRSTSDAELLYDAKYGKLEGGKLTKEQAMALRRRVGGTAKDYWKGWVEVKGDFVDRGYVAKDKSATANSVVGLPFLIAVVLSLFGATAFVVSQTS